jgi:hypothetical protein
MAKVAWKSFVHFVFTLSVVGPFSLPFLSAQAAPGAANAILGTWRGSSICADPARDTACRDEVVIYQVDSAASPNGPVRMRADKVVNGSRQPMGGFYLTYDTLQRVWSVELQMRIQARWSFAPTGEQMSGTLTEVPSGRLIRRVAVRRGS